MNNAIERLWLWWSSLPSVVRLYLVGLLLVVISFFLAIAGMFGPTPSGIAYAGMFCLGAAFVRECYAWASARWDSLPVKLAGGVLAIMAAAVATAAAAGTVNDATGQDPTHFKLSVAFLAPIAFVPILALIVFVAGMIGLPFVMLFGMGKSAFSDKIADRDVLLLIARILGVIGLAAGAGWIIEPSSGFDKVLKRTASYSALMMDMHVDTDCSPAPRDRVIRVSEDVVIIGRVTEDGPRFVRIGCALAPEPLVLPPKRH